MKKHDKPTINKLESQLADIALELDRAKLKSAQLEDIIALLPGHIYWKDRNDNYLGCNNNFAKTLGLISRFDILGKNDFDFLDKAAAEKIAHNDQAVIASNQEKEFEEAGFSIDKKPAIYLTKKIPMIDKDKHVIGLLGISVDITDKKHVEELKAKHALTECAAQVSHDIRSPLAALNTVLKNLPNLPEDQRILIRNAVQRINDIANNLLVEYRDEILDQKTCKHSKQKTTHNPELVSSLLDTLLSEKKTQIHNRSIELNLDIDAPAFGLFVKTDPVQFKRMISNLLNNSIEAIEEKGEITIRLEKHTNQVRIRIMDSGKGMAPEVLAKIKQGGSSHGKEKGTGIGIISAMALVKKSQGEFDIKSQVGQGTTIIIDLPIATTPNWFQEELILQPGIKLVVLDDDESIHAIWTSRCQEFLSSITMKHIHHSKTFREYCASADLTNSLFLVDYELLGSDETGLDLIESLNLSAQAILVTSRYEEPNVRTHAKKLNVKIIPKNFSPYIPISLANNEQPELVFIDDDITLTDSWKLAASCKGIKIHTFNHTEDLRKALANLAKTTPIYIDSNLAESISGEEFAKELYEQGFKELYLASGHPRGHFGDLPWIKDFVGKEPPF